MQIPKANRFVRPARAALAVLLLPVGACPAGVVVGRLVVDGDAPTPSPLEPGRDACCQRAAPVDESVVVGEEGGLANAVVSVEPRRGEPPLPDRAAAPAEPAVLTNRDCAFRPRVLIARVGQPLVLANDDPTMHNVSIAMARNGPVNVVVAPDGRRRVPLERPERRPVSVSCNVHRFMQGWLLVRDDPWAAVTDADGAFELPELPAGSWRLRFWREGAPMVGLRVADGQTDARGEVLVEVPESGAADLGEIAVAAEGLR
ncbi:carboxypeptidase regulatory-like domain-containing protein [Botrimarina sp.]|uniref:carboxypeptidase regulatory-like domain-containing protein n=1 Tax=Botrimarina sp. TaxID=2795802 RepID=UPI0032EDD966